MDRFYWSLLAMGAVERPDGLLDMNAAGYEFATVPVLPWAGRVSVATALRTGVPDEDLELVVELIAPSGAVIARRQRTLSSGADRLLHSETSRVNVVVEIDGFDFEEAGLHVVRLTCGDDVDEVDFVVRPHG